MRIDARPDNLIERVGLLANRIPVPVGQAMFGMPTARSLQVAQRTGILTALAERPHSADELAERLGLQATATALLLDVITSLGHLQLRGETYAMTSRARRWLDPDSDTYVGDFIDDTGHYWQWWDGLEALVRLKAFDVLASVVLDTSGQPRVRWWPVALPWSVSRTSGPSVR